MPEDPTRRKVLFLLGGGSFAAIGYLALERAVTSMLGDPGAVSPTGDVVPAVTSTATKTATGIAPTGDIEIERTEEDVVPAVTSTATETATKIVPTEGESGSQVLSELGQVLGGIEIGRTKDGEFVFWLNSLRLFPGKIEFAGQTPNCEPIFQIPFIAYGTYGKCTPTATPRPETNTHTPTLTPPSPTASATSSEAPTQPTMPRPTDTQPVSTEVPPTPTEVPPAPPTDVYTQPAP